LQQGGSGARGSARWDGVDLSKLSWRESLVLNLLSGGEPKRISGSGAGPATLDALVARGLIVHSLDPKTRADAYRITAQGEAALKREQVERAVAEQLADPHHES
jgi:hypothetical protein